MVNRPLSVFQGETLKPLLYISLVFLVLSGCSRYYEMPPALHTNPSTAQDPFVTPTYTPETTLTTVNSPVPSSLQRGINLGNMLEAPREGDWGLRVQEDYFDWIKEAGFDFVRLPVRWSTHAQQSAPYAIDAAFFARVDEVVNWALERDLAIIVDFHHYEEIMPKPRENEERY